MGGGGGGFVFRTAYFFVVAKIHFPKANCVKWVGKAEGRDGIGWEAWHLGKPLGGIGRGAHKTKGHMVPGTIFPCSYDFGCASFSTIYLLNLSYFQASGYLRLASLLAIESYFGITGSFHVVTCV